MPSWNQFGSDPGNTNRIGLIGPFLGIGTTVALTPTLGGSISTEGGIIIDDDGDYIVTSYDPDIHIFDSSGNHVAWCDLTAYGLGWGCRAVPYYDNANDLILTGSEDGTFLEIAVDKTTSPYTLTVTQDATLGTCESSPVMAPDGTVYVAGQWGTIYRYSCAPLTYVNSIPLGEVVTGAIALFECRPASPGCEVIVATQEGALYVLSHDLNTILDSNTDGVADGNEYYAGVTIANPRAYGLDPIAVLGVTGGVSHATVSPHAGKVWAINLITMALEWELTPSCTVTGTDLILGSIGILHHDPSYYMGIVSSTDNYVYGIDLLTGTEVWAYSMGSPGMEAPAIGRFNGVYVVSGDECVHALDGVTGTLSYVDTSLCAGSTSRAGKVAIGPGYTLAVGGVGAGAYIVGP